MHSCTRSRWQTLEWTTCCFCRKLRTWSNCIHTWVTYIRRKLRPHPHVCKYILNNVVCDWKDYLEYAFLLVALWQNCYMKEACWHCWRLNRSHWITVWLFLLQSKSQVECSIYMWVLACETTNHYSLKIFFTVIWLPGILHLQSVFCC